MQVEREAFYAPKHVSGSVENKVRKAKELGESIDYLTFVPDGESTVDINLGTEIDLLKPLDIRIAVITNASLIWRSDVREDLMKADWVSLKIDSTREDVWRRTNRPYRTLRLTSILDGIREFANAYNGELVTETMLVKDVNDDGERLEEVADFLAQLKPTRAYLATPTRPPAERWVKPPDEKVVNQAYQIFSRKVERVEYLIGYEGNAFAFTGNVEEDLLSITAVHPMREEAVSALLSNAKADWRVVDKLITEAKLVKTEYDGKMFYMRSLVRAR
jgi:wyosine [tRNA(Phe)-imidazoG37] synthetase (radical SAM superfamily)